MSTADERPESLAEVAINAVAWHIVDYSMDVADRGGPPQEAWDAAVAEARAWLEGERARARTEIDAERLRQVWDSLGCEQNPNDFHEHVRKQMWSQAGEMIRASTARDNRVYRENQQMDQILARIREICAVPLSVKVDGSSEGDAAMAAMASVILRVIDGTEPSTDHTNGSTT